MSSIADMNNELHSKYESLFAKLDKNEELDSELHETDNATNKWTKLSEEIEQLQQNIDSAGNEIESLWNMIEQERERIAEEKSIYVRPNGFITNMFSKLLPPHPERMKIYDISDEVMRDIPKYRFTPLLLLFGVLSTVVAVAVYLPWLMVSPLSLVMTTTGASAGTYSATIFAITTIIALAIIGTALVNRRGFGRFVTGMALREEQWFRSGAENWTVGQRTKSSVLFGACHIVNIIYPIATLIALSGAGAVFMWIYLREYKKTGDTKRATLAATRFHAVYNMYGFTLIVMVVLCSALLFIV